MQKYLLVGVLVLVQFLSFGQDLEKKWQFSSIEDAEGESIISINSENDFLTLRDGTFSYELEAKENLKASGDYMFQNKLLVFYYNQPTDTIRRYKISELTDSTLIFTENGSNYKFRSSIGEKKEAILQSELNSGEIGRAHV